MWCWALIQIQPLAVSGAGNHYLWLRFIQIKHQRLLGELYDENDHRRDGGFSLYMLRAISVLSPRPSPAAWLLVVWMACWLCPCGRRHVYRFVIFLSGHRHFQSTRSMDKKASLASNLPYQYGAG